MQRNDILLFWLQVAIYLVIHNDECDIQRRDEEQGTVTNANTLFFKCSFAL